MVILETERLILRDLMENDIPRRIEWETTDREWQRWDAPWEYEGLSEAQEKANLEDYVQSLRAMLPRIAAKPAEETRLSFQLQRRDTGEYIGWIGCYHMDEEYNYTEGEGKPALGVCIPPRSSRGMGLGFEAFSAVLSYLQDRGYTELYTQTWSGNVPMLALAAKLGFVEVCRKKDIRLVRGSCYDGLTFQYHPQNSAGVERPAAERSPGC